jgi:hypothetical protein
LSEEVYMDQIKTLNILDKGVKLWNKWKADHPGAEINLIGVDLSNANLPGINLKNALLAHANLSGANLNQACLESADLLGANLYKTQLKHANLQNARLVVARFVKTNLEGANLNGCSVYGASVWNVNLSGASQEDLIISQLNEPVITVDHLEVAQFVYLMLNNEKIRNVIDEITSKAVLILGRFAIPERKKVLDLLRTKLRELGFLPIVFDFEKPTDKDITETIMTLAGMSRFIIADVTNPKSSPLELQATVPNYQVPFVPIIQGEEPFSMLGDLQSKYDWVLDVFRYKDNEELTELFEAAIVNRALKKYYELREKKAGKVKVLTADDFRK